MKTEFSYLQSGAQYFPIINLRVKGKTNELSVKALVDSGASFSVFRPEIAEFIGVDIEKGKAIYLEGIGGRILGYLHIIPTSVGNKNYKCKIVFSRELTVSFNLLGRDNFFDPFLITFFERGKKVIIEEIEQK